MLHPDCESYLESVARWKVEVGLRGWPDVDADRARALFRQGRLARPGPSAEMAAVEDRELPARGGPRPMRIYVPEAPPGARLPVALYFHGGGYVLGGLDESDGEARRIAAETPAITISVDYRKGPEHPFPAGVEDGYDALIWTAHNAGSFGGDPRRLMVGGTSAGAGLAAAVARLAATENGPRIRLLYLFCPWLDLTMSRGSVRDFAEGYALERRDLDWFADAYLGGRRPEAVRHPLVSPVLHPIPKGMPRTLLLIAECDPLRDEAHLFAQQLEAAGVPLIRIDAAGMIHGFNTITHLIPAGAEYLAPIREALRSV
jgi:acetyl esterase